MKRIALSFLVFTGLLFTTSGSHAASVEIGISFDGDSRNGVERLDGDVSAIFPQLNSRGAAGPSVGCAVAKQKAAAKKLSDKIKCHRTALKKDEVVDPECLAKAQFKFNVSFAKAEDKGGCVSTGDAGTVIDDALSDLLVLLPPPDAACAANKLKAVAKKLAGAVKCHKAALGHGEAVDPSCLTKVEDRFLDKFAKAGKRAACGGDAATAELLIDRTLADLLIAIPAVAPAAPLFTEATARLGTPQPCTDSGARPGCYSHYVVLADLDDDADLDIVFASGGGYYEPGTTAPMAVYLNDGAGNFTEVNATVFGGFAGRLRQVAVGDLDGDGDLDLVAPDSWAMQADAVFINNGQATPGFTDEGAARLGTSSRAGATRLGDLDGDGDLDLVITDWGASPPGSPGTAKVYENDGTGYFTELAGAVPQDTSAQGTGPIDADLFDADGDFDLDLLLASRMGESLLFVNDGTGHFTDAGARLPDQSGPYVYGPDACDVDGDGDLDIWLDNGTAPLREQLVINDGTGAFTDETTARVAMNPSADDNEVQCADLDGDGDLDAIVASLSNEERLFVNDGTGHFTGVIDAFPAVGDSTLGLDLGDLDSDGRLDAVTAQGESGIFLNRIYLGATAQPADARAPSFRALAGGSLPASAQLRFAVQDNAVTDVGARLREAHVEVDGGGSLPARFAGGDLWQVPAGSLPVGVLRYRACATDWSGNQGCSSFIDLTIIADARNDGFR